MCPVPFNSARAFVALGSWLVEGTKYVCLQGLLRKHLLLTVVGVEPKEAESPVEILFIMDATWPQGAAAVRWNRITSSLTKFLQNYHDHKIRRTSVRDTWRHWTSVSTLLDLISSVYRDLPHWRSNQRPKSRNFTTEQSVCIAHKWRQIN